MGRNNSRKVNSMVDDKQLIRSCLQGEKEEFRKLVEKYWGKTIAMAINVLGNREDAEDVCQEAFLQVYSHLAEFDFKMNFQKWLYSILYKRCLDNLRKRRRLINFFNKLKKEKKSLLRFKVNVNSASSSLFLTHRILKKLSPKERTALFLWAREGFTSSEIGAVLKCSAPTARVHLFKARKKIKAALERENA